MIVAALSVMGGVVTLIVATGAVSKTNDVVSEQSFDLVHAGFEYALKQIKDGGNPNGHTRNLGSGNFTVTYSAPTLTVNSRVGAMYGSSSPTYTIQAASGGDMAACLITNAGVAYWANGNRDLQGITLRNNCQTQITIDTMQVSWTGATTQRLKRVRIDNHNDYDSTAGVLSGDTIPAASFADHDIPTCTDPVMPFTYLRFSVNMGTGRTYTLDFFMSDSTIKSVSFVL